MLDSGALTRSIISRTYIPVSSHRETLAVFNDKQLFLKCRTFVIDYQKKGTLSFGRRSKPARRYGCQEITNQQLRPLYASLDDSNSDSSQTLDNSKGKTNYEWWDSVTETLTLGSTFTGLFLMAPQVKSNTFTVLSVLFLP